MSNGYVEPSNHVKEIQKYMKGTSISLLYSFFFLVSDLLCNFDKENNNRGDRLFHNIFHVYGTMLLLRRAKLENDRAYVTKLVSKLFVNVELLEKSDIIFVKDKALISLFILCYIIKEFDQDPELPSIVNLDDLRKLIPAINHILDNQDIISEVKSMLELSSSDSQKIDQLILKILDALEFKDKLGILGSTVYDVFSDTNSDLGALINQRDEVCISADSVSDHFYVNLILSTCAYMQELSGHGYFSHDPFLEYVLPNGSSRKDGLCVVLVLPYIQKMITPCDDDNNLIIRYFKDLTFNVDLQYYKRCLSADIPGRQPPKILDYFFSLGFFVSLSLMLKMDIGFLLKNKALKFPNMIKDREICGVFYFYEIINQINFFIKDQDIVTYGVESWRINLLSATDINERTLLLNHPHHCSLFTYSDSHIQSIKANSGFCRQNVIFMPADISHLHNKIMQGIFSAFSAGISIKSSDNVVLLAKLATILTCVALFTNHHNKLFNSLVSQDVYITECCKLPLISELLLALKMKSKSIIAFDFSDLYAVADIPRFFPKLIGYLLEISNININFSDLFLVPLSEYLVHLCISKPEEIKKLFQEYQCQQGVCNNAFSLGYIPNNTNDSQKCAILVPYNVILCIDFEANDLAKSIFTDVIDNLSQQVKNILANNKSCIKVECKLNISDIIYNLQDNSRLDQHPIIQYINKLCSIGLPLDQGKDGNSNDYSDLIIVVNIKTINDTVVSLHIILSLENLAAVCASSLANNDDVPRFTLPTNVEPSISLSITLYNETGAYNTCCSEYFFQRSLKIKRTAVDSIRVDSKNEYIMPAHALSLEGSNYPNQDSFYTQKNDELSHQFIDNASQDAGHYIFPEKQLTSKTSVDKSVSIGLKNIGSSFTKYGRNIVLVPIQRAWCWVCNNPVHKSDGSSVARDEWRSKEEVVVKDVTTTVGELSIQRSYNKNEDDITCTRRERSSSNASSIDSGYETASKCSEIASSESSSNVESDCDGISSSGSFSSMDSGFRTASDGAISITESGIRELDIEGFDHHANQESFSHFLESDRSSNHVSYLDYPNSPSLNIDIRSGLEDDIAPDRSSDAGLPICKLKPRSLNPFDEPNLDEASVLNGSFDNESYSRRSILMHSFCVDNNDASRNQDSVAEDGGSVSNSYPERCNNKYLLFIKNKFISIGCTTIVAAKLISIVSLVSMTCKLSHVRHIKSIVCSLGSGVIIAVGFILCFIMCVLTYNSNNIKEKDGNLEEVSVDYFLPTSEEVECQKV